MPELTRTLAVAALICGGLATPTDVRAQTDPDEAPALRQHIGAHQRVDERRAVLSTGHVDVGPLFVDEKWTLMIHDDTANAGGGKSVWRRPDRTVLQVSDTARLEVPDDPAYAFLNVEPGAPVYVVPETQNPDVVWVGWNTQDPKVMQTIDRGVTMTMTGVQGPGGLVVYLQSGNFSEPKVLWDSTEEPAGVWVDVNTHTHANWVFTEPGTYLVQIAIAAELVDGSKVTDTRELRFAVGSAASTDKAFAAAWNGAVSNRGTGPRTGVVQPAGEQAGDGGALVVVLAAAALAGGLGIIIVRGGRAKRRARSDAAGSPGRGDDEPKAGAA